MKIAVVGGGIFGVIVAYMLAEKYQVDLFEKNNDIFKAASDVNQCRIHRGYHYPRSKETVAEVLRSEKSFKDEFSDTIMSNVDHYYCIAKKNSLTNAKEYLNFCKDNNLEYMISDLEVINKNSIDLCVKVKENLFDHEKLKNICWQKLKKSSVNILLEKKATKEILDVYDFVVICTYAELNQLIEKYSNMQYNYQYELVEKIFVKLPKSFDAKSIVIMDGPFVCVDPVGNTGSFIISDVKHSIHQTDIGKQPQIDKKFLPLLNKGIIKNPSITKYGIIIDSASQFMPEIKNVKYLGSSFCIKTVLPNFDKTDARPTLVRSIKNNMVTVFSGKIPTCVETVKKVVQMVDKFNC